MPDVMYALSLKQPWATLLVHGLKTVEIRRWPTARLGHVLIHAARMSDPQEQAWNRLPEQLRAEADKTGGIIGAGELTGCIAYHTAAAFAADRNRHLNDPTWFRPPVLYGFTFVNLRPLPFRLYPGWMRFFPVADVAPARRRSRQRKPPERRQGGRLS
jgi:hypothetical protein